MGKIQKNRIRTKSSTIKHKPLKNVESDAEPTKNLSKKSSKILNKIAFVDKSGDNSNLVEKRQSKRDKLKQNKEKFKAKVNILLKSKLQKKQKEKQKKQKKTMIKTKELTTAVTDLTAMRNALPSLTDSLPSLNSLFKLKSNAAIKTGVPQFDRKLKKDTTKEAEVGIGVKRITKSIKTKNKKKQFMKRYDYFQKLVADKAYKLNPREAIALHIRNRRKEEESQLLLP